MEYKYNEKKYGKHIYDNGFCTRFISYELTVLVKYLKFMNINKKDTEEFLYNFCKKYIEGFNKVKYYKTIDKAIRYGRSKPLIIVEKIHILHKELEYIKGLDLDDEYKKLLMSLLVNRKIAYEINKINNGQNVHLSSYFNGTKKRFREVFKSANISGKGYKIDDMINFLVQNKIIESIIKGDIVLSYMSKIYDVDYNNNIFYKYDKDDIFDEISEFDNIGYIYEYYIGSKKIIKCENKNCDVYCKRKSNSQKYCTKCWKEKEKEIKRDTWHKNKDKYRC